MGRLLRRLRYWLGRDDHEAALAEELEFHRAMKQQELESGGIAPEDARFSSRREMGNMTRAREDSRGVWIWPWLDNTIQDLRYAVRRLIATPSFTLPVLAILVITMGLTTTLYAIVQMAFFRPWPVPDADRVVIVEARTTRPGATTFTTGPVQYRYLREHSLTADLAIVGEQNRRVGDLPFSEWTNTRIVSGNYFRVLRLPIAAGRPLDDSDDVRGSAAAAVISHRLAELQFGSPGGAIGKAVRVGKVPFTVVGVAAPGVRDKRTPPVSPDVWLPLGSLTLLPPDGPNGGVTGEQYLDAPDGCCMQMFTRLDAGTSRDSVEAELQVLASTFAAMHRITPAEIRVHSTAYLDAPMAGRYINIALLFTLAVGVILLLACANVGNLVLARAMSRRADVSVRLWLGATRGRLVRHLLSETLILAIVGGLLSLAVAAYLIPASWSRFFPWLPIENAFNLSTLPFVLGLALVVALLAGTLPALKATRIGHGMRVVGRVPVRLRTALLGLQVAGSVLLLVGAALLGRGIQHASGDGLGMTVDGLVSIRLGIPFRTYDGPQYDQIAREIVGRLEQAQLGPVGGTEFPVLGSYRTTRHVRLGENLPATARTIGTQYVTPGFFEVLGIDRINGRLFDRHSQPDDVVIDQSLARLLWPDRSPIGRTFLDFDQPRGGREKRVIGVVADAKTQRVDLTFPTYYQQSYGLHSVILRDGPNVVTRAQNLIRSVAPSAAAAAEAPSTRVREQLTSAIVGAVAGAGIAGIALLLASVGTLGVFRYVVTERLTEIGVRKALGATGHDVVLLVLRGIAAPIAGGLVIGLAGAQALGVLLEQSLYGISPRDPLAYAVVLSVLAVVIFLALVGPARRAVRVDPVSMLRAE